MKYGYRPLLPSTRFLQFNNFDDIDKISEETAAVLIETVQAEAGIILPEAGFLELIREKCNETGSMLIFDEIQMGMGRTGTLFAFEQFGVMPDILCLAKAFGGGMPLGAFISSMEKMNTLTFNPELGHITTFGGHPVCCAAALAGLEVIFEEKILDGVDKKGKLFRNLLADHPTIAEIRQVGLMLGVELKDKSKLRELMIRFKKHRLIVDQFLFNDNSFRIAPPLTITTEEVRQVSKSILDCLSSIEN